MSKVKQLTAAVAAMGLAGVAFAGSYSEGCDCEVTVPKYAGGVRVGVEALYWGADVKDTEYAFTFQSQSGVDTFRSHNVSSEKDWGYAIELAYVAAGTGNDFVVNWTDHEFKASDTIALAGNSNGEIHGLFAFSNAGDGELPELVSGGSPSLYSDTTLESAKGAYDVDYTKVDFEAGQAIKVGHDSVHLRFHAGLRYADIDTKFAVHYQDDSGSINANAVAESDFDGLGPRMGVDGTWVLGNNFSLVAEASAALLVGDVSASQKFEDHQDGTPPAEYKFAHRVSYDHKVVPNLEMRVGVNYQHHFSNSSELNLQAGYHLTNYFDVDYKFDNSGTDVAFYGLYVGANYTL